MGEIEAYNSRALLEAWGVYVGDLYVYVKVIGGMDAWRHYLLNPPYRKAKSSNY